MNAPSPWIDRIRVQLSEWRRRNWGEYPTAILLHPEVVSDLQRTSVDLAGPWAFNPHKGEWTFEGVPCLASMDTGMVKLR